MDAWLIIVIIAVVAAVVVYFVRKSKKKESVPTDTDVFADAYFIKTSPKGVKIYAKYTPTDEIIAEVDRGLQVIFDIAANHGYSAYLFHTLYKVALIPRAPECEGIGFLKEYRTTQYDGGEFDKDPRPGYVKICVAGEFKSTGGVPTIAVVDDISMTARATSYEAEHAVLYYNDVNKYNATLDHSSGGGHPIFPENTL